MCGGCRAVVDGKIVFVCVDGPEFDAHQVDFDSLMRRNNAYRDIEALKEHECRIDVTAGGWKKSMTTLPLKERMKISRHEMAAQKPGERVRNFNEVNLGFSQQIAMEEAQRCLECKDAPCSQSCPVHVKIPQFIARIAEGDNLGAVDTILQDNFLPAICGRVCPQENLCESQCVLGKKGKPVAIGNLERFSADSTVCIAR